MSAVESVAASVYHATLVGLTHHEIPEYEFKRTPGKAGTEKINTGRTKTVRPSERECMVLMFPQAWGSTALGFGGIGGAAITTAYTVIVQGPYGDCCVYFQGRIAYRIARPNTRFWEDFKQMAMSEVAGAVSKYERQEDPQ